MYLMVNDLAFHDAIADIAIFKQITKPKANATVSKQPGKVMLQRRRP
jgi:hypothetical protein